jgi:excisionase family DNA binding protein
VTNERDDSAPVRPVQSRTRSALLSISRASQILGVNETTLRQWTDEGKIRAFITPGGHRRYSEADLRRFMGSQRKVHGIRDLVAKMQETPAIELQLAHTQFPMTSWYGELDQESISLLGHFGRRIHRLVIACITKQVAQEEAVEQAREIGHELGTFLSGKGLSLSDSLEAFLLHRSPLIDATAELMRKREALNERAAEAVPMVAHITDQVLLSMVRAHQDHQTGAPAEVEE